MRANRINKKGLIYKILNVCKTQLESSFALSYSIQDKKLFLLFYLFYVIWICFVSIGYPAIIALLLSLKNKKSLLEWWTLG